MPNPGNEIGPTVPSKVYTKQYYLYEAAGWQEFLNSKGQYLQLRDRQVLKVAKLAAGELILDLGCGRGEMLVWSIKLGAKAIGIDYSESAVFIAHEAIENASSVEVSQGKAFVCRADAKYLPISSDSFDKAIMIDLFEHLYPWELDLCLKEIYRILRPGGILIVHTTPNRWYANLGYGIEQITRHLLHGHLPTYLQWKLPRNDFQLKLHVNEVNAVKLAKTLKAAGFVVGLFFLPEREGRDI